MIFVPVDDSKGSCGEIRRRLTRVDSLGFWKKERIPTGGWKLKLLRIGGRGTFRKWGLNYQQKSFVDKLLI